MRLCVLIFSFLFHIFVSFSISSFFFFNDTAPTEIYTLSLHDALPISVLSWLTTVTVLGWFVLEFYMAIYFAFWAWFCEINRDRKSTRLNSSHQIISYAVFCLKKKNKKNNKSLQHQNRTRHILKITTID